MRLNLANSILAAIMLLQASFVQAATPFTHVYYLFLKHSGSGCAECYIPMILTRVPIDKANLGSVKLDNALVMTYERDSIWEDSGNCQPIEITPASVSLPERSLRWKDKDYRYQEIDAREAIHLLEHPWGTIPISRPAPAYSRDKVVSIAETRQSNAFDKMHGTENSASASGSKHSCYQELLQDLKAYRE